MMGLQRQGSGMPSSSNWSAGMPSSSNGDHKVVGIQRPTPGHTRMYEGGLRGSNVKNPSRLSKVKRASQSWRFPSCSVAFVLIICLLGLVASFFSGQFLMGGRNFSQLDDVSGKSDRQRWIRRSENTGKQGLDVKDRDLPGSDNSGGNARDWFDNGGIRIGVDGNKNSELLGVAKKQESGSLYNEGGRDELVEIGARYEYRHVNNKENQDTEGEAYQKEVSHLSKLDLDEYDDHGDEEEVEKKAEVVDDDEEVPEKLEDQLDQELTAKEQDTAAADVAVHIRDNPRTSRVQRVTRTKKRRHSSTPSCNIGFLRTTEGLREPQGDVAFVNLSLNYVLSEERPLGNTDWVPKFGGHQSLLEREETYHAKDQTLHCGFVKAPDGKPGTGFELSEDDKEYLSHCHIAVSSCIFGAWDNLRTPTNKKMSNSSKEKVCFVMFVDQKSLDVIRREGQRPDDKGILGLWKIVLIKNLPYEDGRRNGKVPKLLTHRLFPNARYSIWLDSKLRLEADPLLILEHFLWRGNHEYAISNHYDRHCVWEEVAQNKRLNKFNHSIIDEQFRFYQREGLPRFNRSDTNRYLPSHVPEGSFIVRAHTPMSNLFSCLWFNEVERFTPRDQLSFAATYIKLTRMNPTKQLRLNMFRDCERKAMAKLFHHRVGVGNSVTHI